MRSGAGHEHHAAPQTDAELLRSIRDGVRSTYEEILQRPLPREIEAILSRLDVEADFERQDGLDELIH
jgi:hypothetical protein